MVAVIHEQGTRTKYDERLVIRTEARSEALTGGAGESSCFVAFVRRTPRCQVPVVSRRLGEKVEVWLRLGLHDFQRPDPSRAW